MPCKRWTRRTRVRSKNNKSWSEAPKPRSTLAEEPRAHKSKRFTDKLWELLHRIVITEEIIKLLGHHAEWLTGLIVDSIDFVTSMQTIGSVSVVIFTLIVKIFLNK